MLFLKPMLRTVILSIILVLLIIYLGIKYHWSDYLKDSGSKNTSTLKIPQQNKTVKNTSFSSVTNTLVSESFNPEILKTQNQNDLISSLNKDQVTELCRKLLKQSIKNNDQLDLAVVNCVVSNYQETLQTVADDLSLEKKEKLRNICQNQIAIESQYSKIEKQLLVGICTSDDLSQ